MSQYAENENVPEGYSKGQDRWYSTSQKGGDIVKKVELTMAEDLKYQVIKRLADEGGSKDRAALTLGITRRQVNRLLNAYKEKGKSAFVHGNRGRQPATTISEKTRKDVVDLYRNKYYDANFEHFTELLAEHEGIYMSTFSVTSILEEQYILSPRVTKAKKKRVKAELEKKQEQAQTVKEARAVQANLVRVEEAHPRRPRCAYFGEMLQMDASSYEWIPNCTWYLHIAVDDAAGALVGAWFDSQETLNGYYHVFHQVLTNYGIPFKFFTDRRTVFEYKKKNAPSMDEDTYTQFAYACKQLGVELESNSVPQSKGRVERLNQTLQSRLPIELRLAGIATMEQANEFLTNYIKEFNKKFALPTDSIKSVFEMQPPEEKINLILAVLDERTVDCGHAVQFKNRHYRMLDEHGMPVNYLKGTKVMVIQAYDGRLFCCVNDSRVYALEAIPEHMAKSKNFDADYQKPQPKQQYIPPMSHPWKRSSYNNFVHIQPHHLHDAHNLANA